MPVPRDFPWQDLAAPGGRILLFVMDGAGDLPAEGGTPLERAATPNLDRLAASGALGSHLPVAVGVAPGSGVAHLALFGYDPFAHATGRGVFEALGLGMELGPGDLAVRGNLARFDGKVVSDRRAGRIGGGEAAGLLSVLSRIDMVEGCEATLAAGAGHRFALRFRGPGLDGPLPGNDPGGDGLEADFPAGGRETRRSRQVLEAWSAAARDALSGLGKANGALLRGADVLRPIPSLWTRHGITARGVATYPAYRGAARLVGMEAPQAPRDPAARVAQAASADEDLVFFHFKDTDPAGEDGDADAKTAAVERADAELGALVEKGGFDVVVVTADHCTPWSLRRHSWHPVPFLVHGESVTADSASRFTEAEAAGGACGRLSATDLLPAALFLAGRLKTWMP